MQPCRRSPVLLRTQSDPTAQENHLLWAVQGDHSQIITRFTDFRARRDNYDHLVLSVPQHKPKILTQ